MRPASQLAESAPPTERPSRPLLARRVGLVPVWVIALALVILGLTTADVRSNGAFSHFDHDVSRWMLELNLRDTLWPKRLVYLLTLPGQRGTVLLFTIPTVAYLTWRARSLGPVLRYALALVAMTVAVYALKDWVARPAPVISVRRPPEPTSYPSGHVANATLVWGVVWWSAREVDPRMVLTRVLNVVWLAGPVLVAIGMTLLDYHWVSDFVGGACVAVVLLAMVTLPIWSRVSEPFDRRIWPARAASR